MCIDNYEFFDGDVTWEQGRDACRSRGAHLVTMNTNAEWEMVRAAIVIKVAGATTNQHWFIGLRKVNGTWTWQEPAGETRGTLAANDQRWSMMNRVMISTSRVLKSSLIIEANKAISIT